MRLGRAMPDLQATSLGLHRLEKNNGGTGLSYRPVTLCFLKGLNVKEPVPG